MHGRFGGGAPRPPRTVEVPLVCTLQELAKGCTKKRKITRHVMRDGKPQPKEARHNPLERPSSVNLQPTLTSSV